MTSDLTGACPAAPVQRVLAAPSESMRAVAVDGRWLYYATATAIHRRLLAPSASTAPPANDDWQQAVALDGPLPLHAVGRVGHASAQPGESDLVAPRTVWYAFRPALSGRVTIQVTWGLTFNSGVFTGTPPSALTQLPPAPFGAVDVVGGQTYWIVVYGYGDPTYEPFTIDIAPTG